MKAGRAIALADAEKAITNHPGYRAFVEWEALKRTLDVVHMPNHHELLSLLERVSNDVPTSMSLAPAAPEGPANALFDLASRHLFNYLASTSALVDHSRRLMNMYEGSVIREEYEMKRAEITASMAARFMKGLRNFTLHRSLPPFLHRLKYTAGEHPSLISEMGLSAGSLLLGSWDDGGVSEMIRAADREFGQVDLRPLVLKHGELVRNLYGWLFPEFQQLHGSELHDVNSLIMRFNEIFTGSDGQ